MYGRNAVDSPFMEGERESNIVNKMGIVKFNLSLFSDS